MQKAQECLDRIVLYMEDNGDESGWRLLFEWVKTGYITQKEFLYIIRELA